MSESWRWMPGLLGLSERCGPVSICVEERNLRQEHFLRCSAFGGLQALGSESSVRGQGPRSQECFPSCFSAAVM